MLPQTQGAGPAKAEGSWRRTGFLESKGNATVGSGPKDSCDYQENRIVKGMDKLNTNWGV